MFFSKSESIKELVGEHAVVVMKCYDKYEEAIGSILGGANRSEVEVYTNTMRSLESEADSVRHQIIRSLLEGGLLVDSRKSIMHVIEGVDGVADITEDIIQEIYIQQINLPKFTHEAIIKMSKLTRDQLILLIETIKGGVVTSYKVKEMTKLIQEIENLESKVDDLQQGIVKELFETDMALAEKMQIREIINLIGAMSDTIEDISDSVEIIMMARKV